MPWKERSIVEEAMRFVLRLKDGENIASLCPEFGISRVTGYKIYEHYKECGLEGLTDRARTPYRYANKLPAQLETIIVTMRREKPTWGACKLRELLLRKLPNNVHSPASPCRATKAHVSHSGR
jgi:putative transposase